MLTLPRSMPSADDEELSARGLSPRDPLLVTKLQPPPAPIDLIPRPHVTTRIEPDAGQQLTVLCAPTGFGKTTALREWSMVTPRTVGWLSLDSRDNVPDRFWSYAIAAVEACQPGFGATTRSLLVAPQAVTAEYVVTAFINELASLSGTFSLVLDDYHVVVDDIVHRSVCYLIDHLPPQLHLVIASRVDPPLTIPRLRAQGRLVELRGPELRFQCAEASRFLIEGMGLELGDADVKRLLNRTEGWVAGLRLAALAMRQHDDPTEFIDTFSGQHRSIGDYLAVEVLDQQPEELKRFMIETSFLERLNGPLCDAVTQRTDGQAMLETLERANAFLVPLDDERHWYRYQGLFADVLRDRFARDCVESIAAIHRRAAVWCYDNQMTREAVEYAVASGDLELVAGIVEQRACAMLANGDLNTISSWIALIPRETIEARPILGCLQAWVLVLTGQVDEAELLLDAVERSGLEHGLTNALGEIAAIRAHTARLRYRLPLAIELSRQAAELTPAHSLSLRRAIALNYGIALWWSWEADLAEHAFHEAGELAAAGGEHAAAVVAVCHRARLRADQGLLDAAWALFEEAVALADRLGVSSLPSQSFVHLGMAYLLIERNDLIEAERQLRDALVLGEAGGKVDHIILSHLALSHVQRARGDLAGARRASRYAQAAFDRSPVAHLAAWVETNWVLLWLAEGDLSAAERWASSTLTRIDESAGWRAEVERMTLAHVRLAQDRPGDALTALMPILNRSAETLPKGWVTCRIDALALAACIFEREGQHRAALDTLAEAMRLAEPHGHIRVFADKGPTLATLLSQLPASNGASRDYIARLRAACGDSRPNGNLRRTRTASATPLSQRELEVLRHIHAGLSNREIAESLFVTVGTVKRHTNSIYSKLAVGSRTQALARARTLDLLGA